ncbi:MAG: hypothetical protein AAFX76_09280 [Planctomycetota bacterium]
MSIHLFKTGRTVATRGVAAELTALQMQQLLFRHTTGDWLELSEDDREQNRLAVKNGLRILSSYAITADLTVWVITEWDRSVTTLLLPSEY